jgi:hypothetical protein
MREVLLGALRWVIRVALFLLSIETLAGIADYFGRWEWWVKLLEAYPSL